MTQEIQPRKNPGRPPFPETRELMEKIIANLPENEVWIANTDMASILGVPSLTCSTLAKRLEREGRLYTRLDGFRLYLRR